MSTPPTHDQAHASKQPRPKQDRSARRTENKKKNLSAFMESTQLAPASKPRNIRIIVADYLDHCDRCARQSTMVAASAARTALCGRFSFSETASLASVDAGAPSVHRFCKEELFWRRSSRDSQRKSIHVSQQQCRDTLVMVRSSRKCGIEYLNFRICLTGEFQSALHDEFICQWAEILKLHNMFIFHD